MEIAVEERRLEPVSRPNYYQIVNRMLVSPGQFFREELDFIGLRRSLGFLTLSSLFFTLAELSLIHQAYLKLSILNFMNAVIMPALCAVTGYALIRGLSGREILFRRLFAVYALSSGLMMLMAWIPLFIWITEPWRWLLIGLGLVKGCGLSRGQSLLVVALSLLLLVALFWLMNEAVLLWR